MKLLLRKIGKVLLAGVIAFAVLELFCTAYFNKPVHVTCEDGATDYVWEKNTFYSNWTEGFAFGRTNNEGYYDRKDYVPGSKVDILVMGASYMQAEQVLQKYSTASLLEKEFPDKTVYNIGVAGHAFLTNICDLNAALDKYRPEYVIIDTQVVSFDSCELEQVLNGTFPRLESYDTGLLRKLENSSFLRLLYYQLTFYRNDHGGLFNPPELLPLFGNGHKDISEPAEPVKSNDDALVTDAVISEQEAEYNEQLLDAVFAYAAETAEKYGTEIIIVYHPKTWLDGYGGMWVYDGAVHTPFAGLCDKYGIHLVDMSERYIAEYENDYTLPYGFINSTVGYGHLNRRGHVMISEEIAALIREVE